LVFNIYNQESYEHALYAIKAEQMLLIRDKNKSFSSLCAHLVILKCRLCFKLSALIVFIM